MNDIELFGAHYLQQISDHVTGGAVHIEPGIWLNVPATTNPVADASVARLAYLSAPNPFRTTPTPPQVTLAMVTDPNSVLAADIVGQTITETVVLIVAGADQNTNNIPFLVTNADVGQVSATFWIETVQDSRRITIGTFCSCSTPRRYSSTSWG